MQSLPALAHTLKLILMKTSIETWWRLLQRKKNPLGALKNAWKCGCTLGQNGQEYRLQYWTTRSSIRLFARLLRTTHFARTLCCAHSLDCSLTLLTPSLVGKWMIRLLFYLCFSLIWPIVGCFVEHGEQEQEQEYVINHVVFWQSRRKNPSNSIQRSIKFSGLANKGKSTLPSPNSILFEVWLFPYPPLLPENKAIIHPLLPNFTFNPLSQHNASTKYQVLSIFEVWLYEHDLYPKPLLAPCSLSTLPSTPCLSLPTKYIITNFILDEVWLLLPYSPLYRRSLSPQSPFSSSI